MLDGRQFMQNKKKWLRVGCSSVVDSARSLCPRSKCYKFDNFSFDQPTYCVRFVQQEMRPKQLHQIESLVRQTTICADGILIAITVHAVCRTEANANIFIPEIEF